MRLVPKDKVGKIEFCESRLGKWAENADEIGTTPEMVALLADSTGEARAAFDEQQRAQSAAQAATLKLDNAIKKMQTQAATIVVYVRAKASVTGDRGVYALASIPVPAKPSPIAAPGTPTGFSAKLEEATGAPESEVGMQESARQQLHVLRDLTANRWRPVRAPCQSRQETLCRPNHPARHGAPGVSDTSRPLDGCGSYSALLRQLRHQRKKDRHEIRARDDGGVSDGTMKSER